MKIVNILGTDYEIGIKKMDDDEGLGKSNADGYCDHSSSKIVVADLEDEKHFYWQNEEDKDRYAKMVLRHELIHAFLNESGLSASTVVPDSGWAKNEEMVDWIALQFPKIAKVFKELGCE